MEINLEKRPDSRPIFETLSDVHEIAEMLAVLAGVPISPGETLLFIDEIQFSVGAIRMLRYFSKIEIILIAVMTPGAQLSIINIIPHLCNLQLPKLSDPS